MTNTKQQTDWFEDAVDMLARREGWDRSQADMSIAAYTRQLPDNAIMTTEEIESMVNELEQMAITEAEDTDI